MMRFVCDRCKKIEDSEPPRPSIIFSISAYFYKSGQDECIEKLELCMGCAESYTQWVKVAKEGMGE